MTAMDMDTAGTSADAPATAAAIGRQDSSAPGRPHDDLRAVLSIGLVRARVELIQLSRNRGLLVFTFLMPVVMLTVLGSIFRGTIDHTTVKYQTIYATGMLGMCVINACLQNLAFQIATERHGKALKRLRATPMPRASYFLGKIAMVLVATFAQCTVMLALGTTLLGLQLPTSPSRWLTFVWVLGLGVIACSLLGFALSSVIQSETGGAVIWLPLMVLQFISGVFFVFSTLPVGLQQAASFFPVKWLCQGMRSVFLPDQFQVLEPAGSWEHGRTALVLLAWCVVGLAACLKTFRWKGRHDG
jgi:ABC-2 type transport system permease protein